ncbi:MAG: chemotaxis protein CheB [Pseudanabaenaceae cyanobacterium bins.39]|nr:chemotaxis protein CheB [Pseudanabaenaceae cyanobacterium bins.39]
MLPPQNSPVSQMFVVGLGASAGGLHALEQFFSAMSSDSGAAFVVVQHLSPDFESLMQDLLSQHTNMPVHEATENVELQPNHIYIIPPGQNLVIQFGRLHLISQPPRPRHQINLPINLFFASLAKDCGDRAIGIILSGGGGDGREGLQTIREQGGLTLAQDPNTAEFSSMPNSAIDADIVDRIMAPEDLALTVYEWIQQKKLGGYPLENHEIPDLDPVILQQILNLVEKSENLDFSHYKISTLSRRTYLRCSLAGCNTITEYLNFLESSPEERRQLKQDYLISVTKFFRDREAWHVLETEVLPNLINTLSITKADTFRAWVSACATGEEAYSLAILIDHVMDKIGKHFPIKIFATDVDKKALQRASEGAYSDKIAKDIPEALLHKYFIWRNGQFHVKRRIRETIIFAPHNLTENPGFTQMHLICCRNVLIYMHPNSQRQILRTIHFSLAIKGILFLGECENLSDLHLEFTAMSEKWKIFQKRRDIRPPLINAPNTAKISSLAITPKSKSQSKGELKSPLDPLLQQALVNVYASRQATCVLLDEQQNILHVVVDAAQLLQVPQGKVTQQITAMLPEDLRVPVSTALNRAERDLVPISYAGIPVKTATGDHTLQITATYTASNNNINSFNTLILEDYRLDVRSSRQEGSLQLSEDTTLRIVELEHELQLSRESLKATIEDLETLNEELQATNEELLASNEELQSTNEEYQSQTEELYTINVEYQSKIAELTELTDDFNNLLKSTDIGVIFLDLELNIRKFTDAATIAVNLLTTDIKRPIFHLTHNLENVELLTPLQRVIDTGLPLEQEVRLTNTGKFMLMRIHPYYRHRGSIDGVVITFVNIDQLKETDRQLSASIQLLENTYATTPVGLGIIDSQLCFVKINPTLAEINGLSVEEHLGRPIPEILPDLTDTLIPIFRHILETGEAVLNLEITGSTFAAPDVIRHWVASYYPLPEGIGAVVTEVTALKQTQQELLDHKSRLDYLLSSSPAVIFTCAPSDNYRCLTISNNVQEVLGYTPDDFIQNPDFWVEHIYPADRDRVLAGLQAWDHHHPYNHEYRLRCADGIYRWFDARLKISSIPDNPTELICIGSLIDVTERKMAQNALIKNESLFRLTLDQSGIMVFTQDLNLVYQWVYNPIAGFTEADFLHKTDRDIFGDTDLQKLIDTKQRVLSSQTRQTAQLKLEQSGGDRYFNFKFEPRFDVHGNLSGIAGVAYDVTDEKQFALALTYANEQAQSANLTKSRFLATMSHELRTPLNAILGMTETMQEGILGAISDRQANALETIEQSGMHLLSLISDILDISKIETGQLEPKWENVSVEDLCQHSITLITPQAHKKQISINVHIPKQTPNLWGDERRLHQVLLNLLSNAVKFTPAGGQINLSVQIAEHTIQISIADTGIGIAPENISKIFAPFIQIENDLSRQYEGTGLGLTLVQQLVEIHGGNIYCTSELGNGSRFTVELPLRSPYQLMDNNPEPHEAPSAPPDPSPDNPAALILLAEDNETNIETSVSYLESKGYRVIVAHNGLEAINMTKEQRPDLILMDVQMPVMDGIKAMKLIRQDPQESIKNIPIIALTALAMPGDRDLCLQAGANDYMSKPTKLKLLVAKIQELL